MQTSRENDSSPCRAQTIRKDRAEGEQTPPRGSPTRRNGPPGQSAKESWQVFACATAVPTGREGEEETRPSLLRPSLIEPGHSRPKPTKRRPARKGRAKRRWPSSLARHAWTRSRY